MIYCLYRAKTWEVVNKQTIKEYEDSLIERVNKILLRLFIEIITKSLKERISTAFDIWKKHYFAWIFYQGELIEEIYPLISDRISYEFYSLTQDISINNEEVNESIEEINSFFLEKQKFLMNGVLINKISTKYLKVKLN